MNLHQTCKTSDKRRIICNSTISICKSFSVTLKKTVRERSIENIAKGNTDPGVGYFIQLLWFGLVGLV